jgi:8-oxo-dGTP pyrophosphatase MutT (NUDIX family)
VDPRPAATVVVVRHVAKTGPIEVLVVRRSEDSRFAPGVVVFPGGNVEPGDESLSLRWFGSADERERACAVRELAEETGLALTATGLRERPGRMPGDPDLPPPGLAQLPEIARWIAPESLPVRFDAPFFAVDAGSGDVTPRADGVEADRAWWAEPAGVLRGHDRGEVALLWPTQRMLEVLASCRSVEEVVGLRVEQVAPPRRAAAR